MELLIILIISIFILLFLLLINRNRYFITEYFQDNELSLKTIQSYNSFLSFYNPFCNNWKKAIQSSVASEIPQTPLTNPSQFNTNITPQISDTDLDAYIIDLSHKLSKQFPPICKSMPPNITAETLSEITDMIPNDSVPFQNALSWMNNQLEESHTNLGNALKGYTYEHFADVCQNISSCIATNPQIIDEIKQELKEKQISNQKIQEEALVNKIAKIIDNTALLNSLNANKSLFDKSQKIQDQAQSGELLNQINIPGGKTETKYDMPPGSNNLATIQQTNPERYAELKNNYGGWFQLKTMLEQINSIL